MSSAAIKWARSQNFGSAPLKSVVNAIALRVDKKGATWAAQSTLAQDIGMSPLAILPQAVGGARRNQPDRPQPRSVWSGIRPHYPGHASQVQHHPERPRGGQKSAR